MGWQVSRRLKDGKQQYRMWTTISDGWLTNWVSRRTIIKFIADHALHDYKETIIEAYYEFPHSYGDKDNRKVAMIRDETRQQDYKDYMKRYLDADDPFDFVDKEFQKIKKLLNL